MVKKKNLQAGRSRNPRIWYARSVNEHLRIQNSENGRLKRTAIGELPWLRQSTLIDLHAARTMFPQGSEVAMKFTEIINICEQIRVFIARHGE